MAKSIHTLEIDQVNDIRKALLIGLDCYGQLEQLVNAREIIEASGEKIPESLRAMDPTGSADTVSLFANALLNLEHSKEVVRG